jgi:prevent-host-death family protein
MRSVGVKELKERTTEILKEVSAGERVAVTHYGRVVAHLVPPRRKLSPEEIEEVMAKADEISDAIERAHPGPVDAVKVVREGRRW